MSTEQTVPVVNTNKDNSVPQVDTTKPSWSEMIVETKVAATTTPNVIKEEQKPTGSTKFYKDKYNESDWVLMFYNPSVPLEQWMVKDLLETIDVRARGIRQGKTGKCYADFEDEETWKNVKALSGELVGDVTILVDDVPPRTDAPKNSFNKGQHQGKNSFGVHKKRETFAKKQQHPQKKSNEKEGVKTEKTKKVKKVEPAVVLDETDKEEGWELSDGPVKAIKPKKKAKKQIDGIASTKNYFEGI
ncbi:hypothetical protein ENUP19_0120G0009 [Entamoeba nuttalli]|uniref:RRM domain-containing protein n=1 Tax=Entamoeba nuttalli TaxID=412467 RepID=A0ABQ0DIF8_9EUKA